MRNKSPFWLIALILLGLIALVPLVRAQSSSPAHSRTRSKQTQKSADTTEAPVRPSPLPPGLDVKRLLLKDGSFQPITKYEVRGDRVRYLSAERYDWEEIPESLIDWPATEKYARGVKSGTVELSPEARQVDAEEAAERKREEDETPLVAEGMRLPLQGGVFLLDVFNKQAQLAELNQNGGEINKNMGRNILRATINPLASAKQSIELKGQHARVQSHVPDPFIYVNVEAEPAPDNGKPQDSSQDRRSKDSKAQPDVQNRFRLVRLTSDPKKNLRVVGNIKVAVYGKVSQEQNFVPVKVEPFAGPWLKITPADPLQPGEYALVEILPDNQMNLFVWDFGVNPSAPENPGAWKPEPARPAPSLSTQSPKLEQRKPE